MKFTFGDLVTPIKDNYCFDNDTTVSPGDKGIVLKVTKKSVFVVWELDTDNKSKFKFKELRKITKLGQILD